MKGKTHDLQYGDSPYNICINLPAVETTSVLLGVDTEATSHPAITISTPH